MDKLSPLTSVSETRAVLDAHGLVTKKALGQNFLINDAILQKIISLADINRSDFVLEVGPGIGTLTIALLKHADRVISVERDVNLPAVLAETCAPWADRFTLVNKDALELRQSDLLSSDAAGLRTLPNKLVANLPYAVAATIVLDYVQRFEHLESATIMVQKEVADRMAAQPGSKNYGAYTVKLSLFAQPVGRFGVGPGNFFPPPRVESSVLRLDRHTLRDAGGAPLSDIMLKAVCTMADAAFANRRKTLANSCKAYFAGRGPQGAYVVTALSQIFERADINPGLRGEVLAPSDFVRLGEALMEVSENVS